MCGAGACVRCRLLHSDCISTTPPLSRPADAFHVQPGADFESKASQTPMQVMAASPMVRSAVDGGQAASSALLQLAEGDVSLSSLQELDIATVADINAELGMAAYELDVTEREAEVDAAESACLALLGSCLVKRATHFLSHKHTRPVPRPHRPGPPALSRLPPLARGGLCPRPGHGHAAHRPALARQAGRLKPAPAGVAHGAAGPPTQRGARTGGVPQGTQAASAAGSDAAGGVTQPAATGCRDALR